MIQIFTTDGTEGLDYVSDNGITESKITIKDFLNSANVDFDYIIESVFKKDSRAIVKNDRGFHYGRYCKIYRKAQPEQNHSFGWVIHLRSYENTDAPFNLGYAISSLQFLKPDVYIAMNGQIFH